MLDARLVEAISEVFGLSPDEVTPATSRDSVGEWDSIGHLKLILRLESAFGRRFSAAEIPRLISAAQIQEALNRLQSSS